MKKMIIIISVMLILGVVGAIFLYKNYKRSENNSTPDNNQSENDNHSQKEINDISCFNGEEHAREYASFCVNEFGSLYVRVPYETEQSIEIDKNFFSTEGVKLELDYKVKFATELIEGQGYNFEYIILSEAGDIYIYDLYVLLANKQAKLILKYKLPEKITSFTICDEDREFYPIGDGCITSVKSINEEEYILMYDRSYMTKEEFNNKVRKENKKNAESLE